MSIFSHIYSYRRIFSEKLITQIILIYKVIKLKLITISCFDIINMDKTTFILTRLNNHYFQTSNIWFVRIKTFKDIFVQKLSDLYF